jgi:cytochrome bd ubiquinol oxidase subunit II
MLPPELTVQEAAAPDATLGALLGCVAVGMVVLVPALVWLFRLHLSARLDTGSNV